jgi:hypothetical protein
MNGFADLQLTELFESSTNPRKTFAEEALDSKRKPAAKKKAATKKKADKK